MIYEILIGDRKVAYDLIRKNVKNINLRIYPDGKIKISASPRINLQTIEDFIRSREGFILKALNRFSTSDNLICRECGIEENGVVRFFDEELIIRIKKGRKNEAVRLGQEIWLTLRNPEDVSVKEKTSNEFFRRELENKIAEVLPDLLKILESYRVELPIIKTRRMKTRWGSCNSTKKIVTINTFLIHYPVGCLRFVLMHELCHLVHPDHSGSFYDLLTKAMPEWKHYKKMLNGR